MRVGLFTREYSPLVYGGAGVHVDYLSRELAREIEVEVHCWGPQHSDRENLHVRGSEPWPDITNGTEGKSKARLKPSVSTSPRSKPSRESTSSTPTPGMSPWPVSSPKNSTACPSSSRPLARTPACLEGRAARLRLCHELLDGAHAILDADAIIAVSNGTKADIQAAYPDVDPHRIHVIYNGIDLAEYQKTDQTQALTDYGVDPSVPYVLFVGRITRQKGVTHLVDAISYLPADVQVVLCAGAPDTPEIASELRQKVEAARAHHPRIVWIEKMVTKQEAIQLYSNAQVFCCPSVYEPFGIINLEAMACRAPVVASATGGIKEVVVDGETGYLVPFDQDPVTSFPRDPKSSPVTSLPRLNEMLADPDRCRRFGEAGRRRVEDVFSWTAIAHQTVQLYRSLIDQQKTKNLKLKAKEKANHHVDQHKRRPQPRRH